MALINVPLAGQTLAATQNPIRGNFATINAAFNFDHVEFNIAGQGKHKKVTFPVQPANPAFVLGEIGLFNKLDPVTGINELNIINSLGNDYPFSSSILSTNPVIGTNTSGWTYLASGVVMKWGAATINGSTAVNLNAVGPAFGAAFNAQVSVQTASVQSVSIVSLTAATLTLIANNFPVYWFVIGRE